MYDRNTLIVYMFEMRHARIIGRGDGSMSEWTECWTARSSLV